MQISRKKIGVLIGLFLLLSLCVIILFSAKDTTQVVYAIAPDEVDATFSYTRLNETDCDVRITNKTAATRAYIPSTVIIDDEQYKVTEIALNGFMSSPNLKFVSLPTTIKKIGNTAFANCSALEQIVTRNVEHIGNNAFLGCKSLENILIPQSVYHMGSTVFRNCSTLVRVRAETVGLEWATNWNSNNTVQNVEFNSKYEENLILEPIYEMKLTRSSIVESNIIGYSVAAGQPYSEEFYNDKTIHIPACYEDGKSILSLSNKAFDSNNVDQLIVEYSSTPLTVESCAYMFCSAENIIINRNITYEVLPGENDAENIFNGAAAVNIVLPNSITRIATSMFYDCTRLTNIYFISPSDSIDTENLISDLYDEDSVGIVTLPESDTFTKIGESAFSGTTNIETLYIPNNVKTTGSKIIDGWGQNQTVEIDFTCGQLPDIKDNTLGWHIDWDSGSNCNVLYSKYRITFDACGGEMEEDEKYIDVARGETIGKLPNPSKEVAAFNGWYTEEKGLGELYDESKKLENKNVTLYAYWAWFAIFDSKGGSSCNAIAGIEGEKITLPSPIRGGYNGYWKNDSNNDKYSFGSQYIFPDSSVNFIAQWTEKTFDELRNLSGIYEIWTDNQFKYLNQYAMSGYSFKLMKNFDLDDNWDGISEFNGILDGNNMTITYTNSAVPYGKDYGFICVNRGTIKNVYIQPTIKVLNKPNSAGLAQFGVGGAVGANYNNLEDVKIINTINNPYMDTNGNYDLDIYCSASTGVRIGGVVGINYSIIDGCINYSSIGGGESMGGIVGLNFADAQILNCINCNNIYYNCSNSGSTSMGGIAAIVQDKGQVKNCTNKGIITWAARLNAAQTIYPCMGRLAGRVCESIISENNGAYGSVIIVEDVKMQLYWEQTKNVKDSEVGEIFAVPSSSGGSSGGGCVASGTLITLADGSLKAVQDLTGDETLLVWNMFTGTFDTAPILCIDSDPADRYEVIKLYFSDGTEVKVISEHGFWDYDLNEYVYLGNNAADYIGHWFNKQTADGGGKVQLTEVSVTQEYTTAWSPVTYGYLCYYVNGMLSMPGGISGLFNIFEADGENLKYDEELYRRDIETYGLYTYEEFAGILPVSEELFDAVNGRYLKVAVGKGLIDFDTLSQYIERYSKLFE